MIKKTLLGLGISVLSLIGFSYGYIGQIGSFSTDYDSSFSKTILPNGRLLTQQDGVGKGVFMIHSNMLFFWGTGGIPYLYYYNGQGFFNRYELCKVMDGTDSNPGYCSTYSVNSGSVEVFRDILDSVSSSDYYSYAYGTNPYNFRLCISSSSFGKSLCFKYSSSSATSTIGNSLRLSNLNTLVSVPYDIFGDSPGITGGGGNTGGGGTIINGDNTYLCPTVGQLLNTYSSEYNTGLCYSSSLIYSGNSVVSVSPQSIFELFTDQSDFINYRQLYSNNCNLSPMSDNSACNSIFEGKNLQYSLIAKIPGTVNSLNLYSYCNLALNQDPNTSTCVASGVYNTGVSRQDVINFINNGNYQIISPSSGSVASDVLGSGMTYNGDILDTLQSLYSKFTSLFTTQSGNVVGILPTYIISMLLVIILFKLFKK